MLNLPLFSYPTTLAWVDDDTQLLKSVHLWLNDKRPLKTFISPTECLAFFLRYQPLLPSVNFLQGDPRSDHYELLDHKPVDLNGELLKTLRTHPQKNNEVAVLISDYNMPGMNGIELCRELSSFPMKKILLTGEADHRQAVMAFNDGIIHCFLRKDSPTLTTDITLHTKKLTQQYFREQTKQLLAHLETDEKLPFSDPEFINFFNEWCQANHIRDHYLINSRGDLFVIDEHGKSFYFIIHTERSLHAFADLHADEKEAALFLRSVERREKIPFFGEGLDSWQLNIPQWTHCFHTPQVVQGREKYWWAVVNN